MTDDYDDTNDEFDIAVTRLSRDMRRAAATLSDDEARYLVDAYYMMQDNRMRSHSQRRALEHIGEPHDIIGWLGAQSEILEGQIKVALDIYTRNHMMGSWMRGVYGIGPVISAGLLAHIDIKKAPTAGHIYQYAGIAADGQKPWIKGKKRPFNVQLKTLCWKAGQSFMKFSGRSECYYGKVYLEYKQIQVDTNKRGGFSRQAAEQLENKNYRKETEAYKHYIEGRLPPAHIDAKARRYAVKLFLAHMHDEWYRRHFKKEPPLPYPIAILGHAHLRRAG